MRKYWLYLSYLLRHKWYVMIECFAEGLVWRGLLHDLSKFLPDEFVPYAQYFYGSHPRLSHQAVSSRFDLAWLKHQKRNRHHWQWWILQEDSGRVKILDMDYPFVLEMVCDWVGAGKAKGRFSPKDDRYLETRNWYALNGRQMKLSKFTRKQVENIIGYSQNELE